MVGLKKGGCGCIMKYEGNTDNTNVRDVGVEWRGAGYGGIEASREEEGWLIGGWIV